MASDIPVSIRMVNCAQFHPLKKNIKLRHLVQIYQIFIICHTSEIGNTQRLLVSFDRSLTEKFNDPFENVALLKVLEKKGNR